MAQVRDNNIKLQPDSKKLEPVVDQKLLNLSKSERNQIFGFPWVIGLIVLIMSIYAPSASVRWQTSALGMMLLLTPFFYLAGLSLKWTVHLAVGICTLSIIGVSMQTGGIYSAQIVWLLLIPVMPLRLISAKAAIAWLIVSLLILLVFGQIDHQELMGDMHQSDGGMSTWTFLQRILLCASMLVLPWYYVKTYRQSIAVMRRYNKVIRHKKMELVREQDNKKLFISRLSHEMRTPMNAVVGFSNLLQAQSDQFPQAAGVVEHIQTTSRHLLAIINGIMDYTQLIDGQLTIRQEDVEWASLVLQTFDMFKDRARSMQIEYTCELQAGCPKWIRTDAQRVRQILMNFLEHALQRTPEGFVQIKTQHSVDLIVFTVHDSGTHLSDDELRSLNLIEMNAQDMPVNHLSGTALGLSMAKALAQLMGGDVLAQNHSGQGSSLTLRLPLEVVQSAKYEGVGGLTAGAEKYIEELAIEILVVDDNPVNRLLVQQVIHSQWPLAKVTQADNGQKALTRLSAQKFDLVLMDMLMPEMDGIEATRYVRQDPTSPNQWIPVLGLTANISTEDHVRCLSAGMNDVLLKPFDRQVLVQRIEHLLLTCPLFKIKYAHLFKVTR
jgi:signal transduction histidine kinase/CheY-like chemotaxis protein